MHIKSLTASLAVALLSTSAILADSAMAADLPSRRAPPVYAPPPIPVFTWTGLYVGGQVGYEFGKSTAQATNVLNGAGLGTSASPTGVIGGAHIGYNWAAPSVPFLGGFGGSSLVFGLEGDVDGSNYRSNSLIGVVSDATKQNIQGSARGRIGFAVDRALFYATGGAAFGSLSNNYLNTLNGLGDSFSHTRVGYTVGGGIEYAITNNWSVRAEYRYTDYGAYNDYPVPGITVRNHETENRVQVGFSYKFDTFAPPAAVVAKY